MVNTILVQIAANERAEKEHLMREFIWRAEITAGIFQRVGELRFPITTAQPKFEKSEREKC